MKIRELQLYNFRGIGRKTIDFTDTDGNPKQFTVLIGDNGSGKTSILEAITKALVPVIRSINTEAVKKCDLTNNDIKNRRGWTKVVLSLDIEDIVYRCSNRRRKNANIEFENKLDKNSILREIKQLKAKYDELRDIGQLPLVLYYGTNRVVNEIPQRGHIKEFYIEDALKNCFDNSNSFRDFYEWFKTEEDIELRELRECKNYQSIRLNCVRRAISEMIEGYSDLKIKLNPSRMVVTNPNGDELRIEQLSGGYKAVLSVIADIAKRLALAFPNSTDPLKQEAVILIDELDLHLHPKWQKSIVKDLKRTFPNCQFIVSTHSPFIIQSLKQSELINIEEETQGTATGSFEGWSIEEIQEYKMNVDTKTEIYRALLEKFTDAVDDDNSEKVKELYNKLIRMLSPNSTVRKIIDMDMRAVRSDD